MNKTKLTSLIVTGIFLIAFGIIFFANSSNKEKTSSEEPSSNVEIIDGVQYIKIIAKGGYSPNSTIAKANIPTELIMETNGSYDCSIALVINDIKYRKMLPTTGETKIDLGLNKSGKIIRGLCSMGMYNFSINFK
jgi:plastocyanin domain-containing protein